MIDPIHSLAFSVQSNPGVYALLLGSGVSRSAGIPTGWEITLDLVRKLATLHSEDAGPNPENWYRSKFEKEADYSDILKALAKTQAERQQLLRPYFEPNDPEREQGLKQPTEAHRAIARLIAEGYVKVIITTNFDCLIEQALEDVGVMPTVLSSPDHVEGAQPLIHTRCCVFKAHGNYLDIRIRNTPTELSTYPCQFNQLLDRIIDEFGLIVCGWSADWDDALRKAILRAPSRRFTTYWAARGALNKKANDLIQHRDAQVIPIADADTFFQKVQEQVQSLEEFSRPHPLSTGAAVASLKRYLSEPRYRIRLVDLINEIVDEVVDHVLEVTASITSDTQNRLVSDHTMATAIRLAPRYAEACSTLLAMAPIGGFWAETEHFDIWERALERLALVPDRIGTLSLQRRVQQFPGALLLYALGIGALKADRLQFLGRLMETRVAVNSHLFISPDSNDGFPLGPFVDGREHADQPLKYRLFEALQVHTKQLFTNPESYTFIFDKLEILFSLRCVQLIHESRSHPSQYQFTAGTFLYRQGNTEFTLGEIRDSVLNFQDESPFVKSGILGENAETCWQILTGFQNSVTNIWRSQR